MPPLTREDADRLDETNTTLVQETAPKVKKCVAGSAYTLEELNEAFEWVRPASHWKDPISKTLNFSKEDGSLDVDKLNKVRIAIKFFTATEPTFTSTFYHSTIQITADGYRAGPAGDQ